MGAVISVNNRHENKKRLAFKRLLYCLTVVLVFEGIVRKLLPSVSVAIFFLKDVLCLFGLKLLVGCQIKDIILLRLVNKWKTLSLFFIPLGLNTLFKGFFLAIFGLKQYLLYPVVGVIIPLAFPKSKIVEFNKYLLFLTLLIIPTTVIAILQNSLPATHWLNLSVDGGSLEAFSAAGYLRVSSTFSFTGQYSWFINIVSVILVVVIVLNITYLGRGYKKMYYLLLGILSVFIVIGAFVTGGRTAVLGSGSCILFGLFLAGIKKPGTILLKGGIIVLLFLSGLSVLKEQSPEYFAAYDRRSSGTEEKSHSSEIEERVYHDLFGWVDWLFADDILPIIIGKGLGVMSNGSDKLSEYARHIRAYTWTETDLATTVWEGGLYLLIVWYGFRISIILICYRAWRNSRQKNNPVILSFLLAYITIIGLYGTISNQSPLAIWWWLSIGSFWTLSISTQRSNIRRTISL